jgi:glycosyltransferase involved in cell wall biosynthesis
MAALYFAVPGDIETRTGGTIYDKKVMAGLRAMGWAVEHLAWPASFPYPTAGDLENVRQSLASCPDGALVLIDGLAFGAIPDVAAVEARRLRLVALVHHPLALETGLDPETAERLADSERQALTRARAIVVTSALTAATLALDYDVEIERITIATPGIDKPLVSSSFPRKRESMVEPRDGGSMDSRFRGNDDGGKCDAAGGYIPQILSVGTIMPRKAHDVLVESLARIADLDWHCTIAGSLDHSPETVIDLRNLISGYSMGYRIDLIGNIDDLDPLYRASDLLVSSSRYEGYGMAIAEAMAYGLPVVAARVGAVPDLVGPDAGLLVPVDDPDAMAAALRTLLTDPAERAKLAAGAAKASRAFASWADTAATIASALDAVHL